MSAASTRTSSISLPQAAVVSALIDSVPWLDWHCIPVARRSGALGLRALVDGACEALLHPAHPALKWLAYTLLMNLAPVQVFEDALALKAWSGEESTSASDAEEERERERERERPALALEHVRGPLAQLQELVDATLASVTLGEAVCSLVSPSDGHSLALGWLLLVEARAQLCQLARGDLRQFYVQICRESEWVAALLEAALRLVPGELFAFAFDAADSAPAPPNATDLFLRVAPFSMREACGSAVSALACRALYSTVGGAAGGAGAARGWWSAAPPRPARALQRLVRAYVAPRAVRDQLAQLQQRAGEIEDSEVHIMWSANEVVCEHQVEERTVELRVWLSRSHPLTPPRLSTPALSGPATTHWLSLYLAYQNGTLLNALKMWTRAVDARVERSPQCYICYCRLQPASGRLPRVLCHQCNNRFHDSCLRKWFATSSRSNCPLCRTSF